MSKKINTDSEKKTKTTKTTIPNKNTKQTTKNPTKKINTKTTTKNTKTNKTTKKINKIKTVSKTKKTITKKAIPNKQTTLVQKLNKNLAQYHFNIYQFLPVKIGIITGLALGLLFTDFKNWHDFPRIFSFILAGFLIGRFWYQYFKNHKILTSSLIFSIIFSGILSQGIGFNPQNKIKTDQENLDQLISEVLEKSDKNFFEQTEDNKSTTPNNKETTNLVTNIKADFNLNIPSSTPIYDRFFNRPDEYQHLPLITKKSIFNLEVTNLQGGEKLVVKNKLDIINLKEQKNDIFYYDIPLKSGENEIFVELQNNQNNTIKIKSQKIFLVDSIIMLLGDSLTTGYPIGRQTGENLFIRSPYDAEFYGMKISQNGLAIPTPSKFDAAYENNGLHIGITDFFTEKGKTIFVWNEAQNGETVYGTLLRLDEQRITQRLKNISGILTEKLPVDYVHIMLGTNDAREKQEIPDFKMETWNKNARELIDKIIAQDIPANHIIVSASPNTFYNTLPFRDAWNQIITEKNLTKGIDFTVIHQANPNYFYEDNIHFSTLGKNEISRQIAQRLFEIMNF